MAERSKLPELRMPDAARLAKNLTKIAEQSQRLLRLHLKRQAGSNSFSIPDQGIVAKSLLEFSKKMLLDDPSKLLRAQLAFWQDTMNLWQNASRRMLGDEVTPVAAPEPGDRRFKHDQWAENVVCDFIKQFYLVVARSIQKAVNEVEGLDDKTAAKVDFYTRRLVDAIAPTNFIATNPEVLRTTLESGGENLLQGLSNLLDDLERGNGKLQIKMTDPDAFALGENVAVTPGKVVYQTPLMQLIQYTPTTDQVFKRPLLIVPPWINKFYILDLRPKNSFIKWMVNQGFTVFVISWVNPDEKLADMDFEDYLSFGILAALDAIGKATGVNEINAVSYCIGGTLLAAALAYTAASGDKRIKSATFLTTMLDFSEAGELSVFVDEEQLTRIEKHMEEKGYLEGHHMAGVFNLLRANDLIWSFVVRNYLIGDKPFPFDLLYWNSDSTRMPKRMHSFYLRNMYQHNRLREPGGIELLGEPIDLGKIKTPAYFLSTREDHIAPWQSTYAGAQLLNGSVKFVLAASGHIAGVINPPSANKYGYWTHGKLPIDPDQWLTGAKQHEGSWWPDWFKWIKIRAGIQVEARTPGAGELPVIEDAPGSFVKLRLDG